MVNMAMAMLPVVAGKTKKAKPQTYDYDEIMLTMEKCILPPEMLDVTPSMKDGLDRDTENDLRRFGCEMIQVSGLLLKLPQVAMATGQIILQRFYYIKSIIKHDMIINVIAAIFLAAKIEECPRMVRDVINVSHHIKRKMLNKPDKPMDYYGSDYINLKNDVIKAERRILKVLGFCVHVKHPHKIIITYLQILEHEKNVALARSAWNYMNDSFRSNVFVRFTPEIIACACIFLAARTAKINLPMNPPWWQLFDATYDDIKDISLTIVQLYSSKPIKLAYLESVVKKLKEKRVATSKHTTKGGSFTPSDNLNSPKSEDNLAGDLLNGRSRKIKKDKYIKDKERRYHSQNKETTNESNQSRPNRSRSRSPVERTKKYR